MTQLDETHYCGICKDKTKAKYCLWQYEPEEMKYACNKDHALVVAEKDDFYKRIDIILVEETGDEVFGMLENLVNAIKLKKEQN